MPPSDDPTQPEPTPPVPTVPVAKASPAPDPDPGFVYVDDDYSDFDYDRHPDRPRRVARFVRILLVLMAVGFTAVLVTAAFIRPYEADGTPKTMSTHTQLGMQPCNMVVLTGKPCPACGMTTSFALLVHGDVANSARANWVGTLFCASLFVLAPWAAVSAWRGRLWGVRNGEMFATILLCTLLVLMMGRWAVIMLG